VTVLYVVAVLVGLLVVASVVACFALAVPAMRRATVLPEDVRKRCRQVVARGRGYPFLCAWAVRNGRCPCQPCARAGQERDPGSRQT